MLKTIGYHCSLERYSPSIHLQHIQMAADAGFESISCSDHFYPWSERQGAATQAWAWLGAAMQLSPLPFGIVTAPVQRYHPVIVAQALATLANLFPGRLWCAFGSGQWLNEHVTGGPWPDKTARNARLKEAVEIIRALWRGDSVTYQGQYFQVHEAKLYTPPTIPPKIVIAALSNDTAKFIGSFADGVITTSKPMALQQQFLEAFYQGGGEGKQLYLQAIHCYNADKDTALQEAWQNWRHVALGSTLQSELKTPQHFDEAASQITPEQMASLLRISADPAQHLDWLLQDVALGFEHIYLQSVASDQAATINLFRQEILPKLKQTR
jgi:probable non-F420 flavinoid oxidoreductase